MKNLPHMKIETEIHEKAQAILMRMITQIKIVDQLRVKVEVAVKD